MFLTFCYYYYYYYYINYMNSELIIEISVVS